MDLPENSKEMDEQTLLCPLIAARGIIGHVPPLCPLFPPLSLF